MLQAFPLSRRPDLLLGDKNNGIWKNSDHFTSETERKRVAESFYAPSEVVCMEASTDRARRKVVLV
jgi:hypothetical protein